MMLARYVRLPLVALLMMSALACSERSGNNNALRELRNAIKADQQLATQVVNDNRAAQHKLNTVARDIQQLRDQVLLSEQQLAQLTQLTDTSSAQSSSEKSKEELEKLKRRLLQATLEKAKTSSAISAEKDGIPYIIRQIQEQLKISLGLINQEEDHLNNNRPIIDINAAKRQTDQHIQVLRQYTQATKTAAFKLNKIRDKLKYRVSDAALRIDPARKRLQKLPSPPAATQPVTSPEQNPPISEPLPATP
jgi:hypothetical protein